MLSDAHTTTNLVVARVTSSGTHQGEWGVTDPGLLEQLHAS
jgi:hypothetical protein